MEAYEELRKRNLADNKRILAEIGLGNPFKESIKLTFKKTAPKKKPSAPRKPKRPLSEVLGTYGSLNEIVRKSARLQGQKTVKRYELDEDWEDDGGYEDDDDRDRKQKQRTSHMVAPHMKVPANRPNHYGSIEAFKLDHPKIVVWERFKSNDMKVSENMPNHYGLFEGVEMGTVWLTRMECCRDGVHRPTVAGIHGGPDGAYSIALSGGYDDNVDWGECFTYTGEGGRDLKGTAAKPKNLRSAPQSKDQTLTRGNLALSRNVDTGNPVRVIRGYKLTSQFAPEEGYRYDGLYTVEKAWYTTGSAGFGVWKFALRRLDDQAPPPWEFIESETKSSEPNNNDTKSEEESEKENSNSKVTDKESEEENKENEKIEEKDTEQTDDGIEENEKTETNEEKDKKQSNEENMDKENQEKVTDAEGDL